MAGIITCAREGTDNTTTCINENLRKASRIRKVKEKSDSNIVIKCIKITHKSIKKNWARKKNNSEKIFIKKNENWYKMILHETKTLQIEEITKLMTCR